MAKKLPSKDTHENMLDAKMRDENLRDEEMSGRKVSQRKSDRLWT